MKVAAYYTRDLKDPFINLTFKSWQFHFENQQVDFIAPAEWSALAVEILWSKFARKKGISPLGYENDARDIFKRLAKTWRLWAEKLSYFDSSIDAQNFENEILYMLANQMAAPNSPQWFNTGIFDIYKIKGSAPEGHYAYDFEDDEFKPTSGAFERPQAHACFIQSVNDQLMGAGGLFDLLVREARLFKYGSGTGSNFSAIRGSGESLGSGGVSSGLMSFLDVFDRSAGVIQSGGTTRRAAKMVCLDADHPDVVEFVRYKRREEDKVGMLILGAKEQLEVFEELKAASVKERPLLMQKLESGGISRDLLLRYEEMIIKKIEPNFPVISNEWEGEAYKSVSGQNANFSLRLTEEFFKKLETKEDWPLRARTNGKISRTIGASELWREVTEAAWASADPGVQFHDTINEWNTCKADGEIRASNPCSEYMFLDETACNLASLNLIKFIKVKDTFDFDTQSFEHACRLWTIVLDISVSMASYPSLQMAKNGLRYRTLGLGFANLGGLLMSEGIAYDSEEARALAAALSAIMTGVAYRTSAELAQKLETFQAYEKNETSMLKVLEQHKASLFNEREKLSELTHKPYLAQYGLISPALYQDACDIWEQVCREAGTHGVRNAQVSVIAPTGTIGLMMDCDTTGIEPEYSLVKYKKLAGGRTVKIMNRSMAHALKKLKVANDLIKTIEREVLENEAELSMWLTEDQLKVFDCALASVGNSSRMISNLGHLKMMAAVQPFISGAISKTVNVSYQASPSDIGEIYQTARKLMLKAVAVYRDGSKLGQPLMRARAVVCSQCGLKGLVTTGSCFVCSNCGTSTGCS